MISTKLTEFESSLIRIFFDLYPQWEQILNKQIQLSDIQRINNSSNFSIIFMNNSLSDPLDVNVKMPTEVILGRVTIPKKLQLKK